ncbi:MAG: response regulator [Parvibaculaceae bacterium]
MSATQVNDMQIEGPAGVQKGPRRPWVVLPIAVALSLGTGYAASRATGAYQLWIVVGLGLFAFIGLIAIFAALLGVLHIGRLPKQRAFFQGIVDAIGEACAVSDRSGRVVHANTAYAELTAPNGRLIGVENLYAGFPDAAERVYRLSRAAREGLSAQEEFRLNAGSAAAGAKTDHPVWIRVSVTPINPGLGQKYSLWRLADITADRARQEEVFSRLQYIISYLDRAPCGFFSTTAEGEVAYVNATLAEWLGIDLARTTDGSLKLSDIVGEAGSTLLLSIAPVPAQIVTETLELELTSSDGDPLPVRVVHRIDFGSDGEPQPSRSLVLRAGSDVGIAPVFAGDRDRVLELFNSAPVGLVELDSRGVIINSNPAFIVLSQGKVRGARLTDLVLEADRETVRRAVEQALSGKAETGPIEVIFAGEKQHTGELFLHRLSAGEDGEPGVFIFAMVTTKHSTLEVQLAQSLKMQAVGLLAGGVAHDFNIMLTAIIGFSDLLLAKHRPTDPAFADIMNIKQSANRATNLVRQLLAFSRQQTLRPEVLSLTDVLSDLGEMLGRLLGEKVALKVVHGRDLGLVRADLHQFDQVIINLAVNARDAMPDGGTLTIRTTNVLAEESRKIAPHVMPPGEYVLCEILDTGVGMPPEVLAKIYEPFFSTKEVGKGTGLGLSTVYGIVKQTGGFIFCDSEVGRGTSFRIYLPRHFEKKKAGVQPRDEKKDARPADLTGTGTILLVEDEDAVRSFASRALQSRGYRVIEADSGERALEIVEARAAEIDLVLSDVVMPQMDGPTLLKELRNRGVNTKIVFISGYAEDAFRKNLEGEHEFAFLPKPFTLKQLAEAVKEAMAS